MQNKKRNFRDAKRRRLKKHRKIAALCGLLFVCFLLIYGMVYFVLYRQISKMPKNKIAEGIYIGEVDVSGLTKKEAKEAVDAKEAEYRQNPIVFEAEEQTAQATLEELGFEITNEEKLIKKAMEYGKDGGIIGRYIKIRKLKKEKKVFVPVYEVGSEAAAAVLKERVSGLLTGASNAAITRTGGEFAVTEEKDGVEIDTEATLQKIHTFLNEKWDGTSGTVKVVEKVQKPTITKAELDVIQDELGSFSTYCGSGQARVTNIIVGTGRINGTVLMPGQEFSANDGMSPYSKEDGYVDAGAYENGEVVESLAGGICQVSTTLYNAVINAELEITSRQPHSMVVNYVKPSRDAAIAGDYKDLKFKNNTEYPVYIEGYVENGEVVFRIFGRDTRPEGRTIDFISETVSTEEIPKKYVEDEKSDIGQIKEAKVGHKGVSARLWKVIYENGKEVSRDIFNKSTYKPMANKVYVGIKSDNAEHTKKIQAAIKTQDEQKIQTAIAEINAEKEAAANQAAAEQTAAAETQEGQ